MRFLFIISLLLIVSCGKTKELAQTASPVVDRQSAITITSEDGDLGFRKILLNAVVEERIPTKNQKNRIRNYDEVKNYNMTDDELEDYKEKENYGVKLIVSFPSKTEIFFIPDGIFLSEIVQKLGLVSEGERVFKFLQNGFVKTTRGKIFYLVNLNHEDLMKNDQEFFSIETDYKNNFNSQSIKIDAFKKAKLVVDYKFYSEKLFAKGFFNGGTPCYGSNPDLSSCGSCTWSKEEPSGVYEEAEVSSLTDLGFVVKINGEVLPTSEYRTYNTAKKGFEIIVNQGLTIELIQRPSIVTQKVTAGYNYRGGCGGHIEAITIGSRAEFNVVLKILGRGEELKKIIL
jgi:hypothetical protein